MSSNEIIIYTAKDGKIEVALKEISGKIWLSQSDIAKLFGTSNPNIGMRIRNILKNK